MSKLEELLLAVNKEVLKHHEYVKEHQEKYPNGVDPSDSGNFDDAFQWGVEEGELYAEYNTWCEAYHLVKKIIADE